MADVDPPEPGAWSARQIGARPQWRRVRARIEDEQLIRPWRGAYCTPDAPLVTRLTALELSVGVPLVACDRTAAALHGFGVCDDDQLHVTALDGRSLRRRTGVRIHQWVPRTPTVIADGFPATAPADTAIDVAASGREIDILPVLDAALAVGVPTTDLDEALGRAKGRGGITAVRRWSPRADGRAQSPMESRTRYRLICGGLPPPELQIRVEVPGQTRFLDAGWEPIRLAVEYDGQDFHTGDGQLARDRHRHNQLVATGWTIAYATAADIWRDHERFVAHVRGLHAQLSAGSPTHRS